MLTILSVAQISLGVFLIFVFNSLRTQLKSEKILFWYLILLIFRTGISILDSMEVVLIKLPHIIFVNQSLFFLDAFFLYLFVKSIHREKLFTVKAYIALIPFVAYSIFMIVNAVQVIGDEYFAEMVLVIHANKKKAELPSSGYVYIVSIIVYNICMFGYAYYIHKKFAKQKRSEDIVVNQLNYRWQKQLIIWWFLLVCFPMAAIFTLLLFRIELSFDYELLFPLCLLLLTFIFGFRKFKIKIAELKQTNEEVTVKSIVKETPKYGTLKLNKDRVQEINMEINTAINDEQIYLEPELNLAAFADKFNEKPYLISQVINTIYGKSFQDFINSHRVEYAKELLQQNPEYKIIHIAFDSGFKSKATFNQHFKNKTGYTPTAYKEKMIENFDVNRVSEEQLN